MGDCAPATALSYSWQRSAVPGEYVPNEKRGGGVAWAMMTETLVEYVTTMFGIALGLYRVKRPVRGGALGGMSASEVYSPWPGGYRETVSEQGQVLESSFEAAILRVVLRKELGGSVRPWPQARAVPCRDFLSHSHGFNQTPLGAVWPMARRRCGPMVCLSQRLKWKYWTAAAQIAGHVGDRVTG